MTKRERVDGIYEAIQKVNQVYGKWALCSWDDAV